MGVMKYHSKNMKHPGITDEIHEQMIEDIVKSEGIPGYILSAFFFRVTYLSFLTILRNLCQYFINTLRFLRY